VKTIQICTLVRIVKLKLTGREGVVFINNERYPKNRSPWANPFKIDKKMTREKSIESYELHQEKIENWRIGFERKSFRLLV
jgi:hypothetical protein